jgi:hypothetical protein
MPLHAVVLHPIPGRDFLCNFTDENPESQVEHLYRTHGVSENTAQCPNHQMSYLHTCQYPPTA